MNGPYGCYKVIGTREYMGVAPGNVFTAQLSAGAEQRAIARGDIRLIERVTPTIDHERATYPEGWLNE